MQMRYICLFYAYTQNHVDLCLQANQLPEFINTTNAGSVLRQVQGLDTRLTALSGLQDDEIPVSFDHT